MDGIERDVGSVAKVVRIELPTDLGRAIAARYGVEFTPTFLLFDARAEVVGRAHRIEHGTMVAQLRALVR